MVETGVGNQNLLSSEPGSQRGTVGIQGVWKDPWLNPNGNKFIPRNTQDAWANKWDGIGVAQEANNKTWGTEQIAEGDEHLATSPSSLRIENPPVQLTGAGRPFGTPTGPNNDTSDEEQLFT